MARTFTRVSASSGDYYDVGSAVLLENSGVNTVHAWFKPTSEASPLQLVNCTDSDTASSTFLGIQVRGDLSSTCYFFNGGNKAAISSNSYTAGSWNHVVGVGSSASSRDVHLNGTKASNAETHTPTGGPLIETTIGAFQRTGSNLNPFDGDIAEVAMWDVALSDEECDALYAGVSPLLIRPANLKGYWPLWATHPLIDVAPAGDGNTLTANGTPSAATTHPPVVPFSRKMFTSPLAAPAIVLPSIHLAPTERLVVVSTGTTWKVK